VTERRPSKAREGARPGVATDEPAPQTGAGVRAPEAAAGLQLDELDRQIVDSLRRDGRRSAASVARSLGVAKQTVAKRLDRLLKRDAIRITARVDPVALGFPLFCSIGVRVKPGAMHRVAEQLAAIDYVAWASCSTGSFDVLADAFLPDTDAMFEFLDQRLARMPDITATREWLVLRSAKYVYLWEDARERPAPPSLARDADHESVRGWTTKPGSARELVRLDDLDRAIVQLLRQDGRRPLADIARRVKVTEATVSSRVERLLRTGAVLVIAHVNWPAIGFPVHVNVGVKVTRGHVLEVGDELAAHPNVSYVGYTTGDFDIIADAFLADSASLLQFLNADLPAIPAVQSTETWHVLSVAKVNYQWEGEKIGRVAGE